MLELGQRERVVVDAEVDRAGTISAAARRPSGAPEVGDSGSSALSTSVVGRPARRRRGPAVGDRLQLAVAVELVAEEVAEQHRARLELLDDRAEPELVDLEEPEVAGQRAPALARGVRPASRRCRPPCSRPARLWTSRAPVRSRIEATIAAVVVLPLVAEITTLPRSRRLREAADRVRLDAGEDLAGQRRAAAAAGGARERADRLGGGHAGGQAHHRGATTRSAPGSDPDRRGSSAIGSPSA